MDTESKQEIRNEIESQIQCFEKLHEKMYNHSIEQENRTSLDDAIKFFKMNGIENGDGVIDWLIYHGGIIEKYAHEFEDPEQYEIMVKSKLSVFKMQDGKMKDVLTDEEYAIVVDCDTPFISRLYGNAFIMDYDPIADVDVEVIKKLVKAEEMELTTDRDVEIRKLAKALSFDIPEEAMLYQGTYTIIKDPVDYIASLGFHVYKEDGIYVVYDGDDFVAELEINGNVLYILCNTPVSLERLDSLIDEESLELVRKEVFSVEDLLAQDYEDL